MSKNVKDLDEFEEITDVSFDGDNAHLALTHKSQGFSANGWHTSLLTKADDIELTDDLIKALQQVTVNLSFEEFLRKFFDMYYSDAELLTKILGMETEYEYYLKENALEDPLDAAPMYLEEALDKFVVMKSAKSISDIPAGDITSILNLQATFEKGVDKFDITFEKDQDSPDSEGVEEVTKTSENNGATPSQETEATPSDESSEVNKTSGDNITEESMDINELMKSAEAQELIKAQIADAVAAQTAEITKAKDAEVAEVKEALTKSAEELETFRVEKAARIEKGFSNLVKSLTFIAEEDQTTAVDTLMKANDAEGVDLGFIITQLEKAQEELTKAKAEFVDSEDGVELQTEEVEIDKATAVADQMAAKYADKKFLD